MTTSSTREYIESLKASNRLGGQVAASRIQAAQPASHAPVPGDLPPGLTGILRRQGISRLYAHQSEAIDAIRQGEHVVVSTPTASGKSLIYHVTLFEAVARNPASRALYIFPLKALTRDQMNALEQWADVDSGLAPTAAVYDGDTSAYRRKKIRDMPPNVVMTNPEMVHLSLLAHHGKWAEFFKNLKLVVVDEVHTYRGLMGSHMAQVLRRLRRICRFYGANPTFVFASATIANPARLAQQLTGLEVRAVGNSGAPSGARHMVLMDPLEGPAKTAILLLKAAMARKLRTIIYTQSRRMAELITLWVQQQAGDLSERISVYRAGLKREERRSIEKELRSGRLLAVVSTSALELGIDIGDLDICILVGYPGSMIATLQRGGRVGRKGQEAALVLLAGQDALDQYYIHHPDAFFKGDAETAVVNPWNAVVLEAHLVCAAAEQPLQIREPWLSAPEIRDMVDRMVGQGDLMLAADGNTLHTLRKRPHMNVDLRSAGRRYRIREGEDLIGDINGFRLYREAHPGAVYLHRGRTYLIHSVDVSTATVQARRQDVDFHTRVRSDSDVAILEVEAELNYDRFRICLGKVRVSDHVVGYDRVHNATGRKLGHTPLEVPPSVFSTDALWFVLESRVCRQAEARGHDLLGTLHAAEHAAIGIMPLLVLADRNDLGGLATPLHPQTGGSTIFIYDGIPGGAGLSRQAFKQHMDMLKGAAAAIDRCNCDKGCPACIHSSKCGSGNHPMDKSGASFVLNRLACSKAAPARDDAEETTAAQPESKSPRQTARRPAAPPVGYGVFDLETQRSAKEVGGWHMAHRMRVSCGVVYDARDDTYAVYRDDEVAHLIAHLRQLDLVVGFNSKRFDYQVLTAYSDFDFSSLPSLDLLEWVHRALGFRLSLDHLAEQTLGINKSGSGLDALDWWQQGEFDKLIDYCRKDVEITRDLYRFARDNGYLIYRRKDGDRYRIPMDHMHEIDA